jgi:hypothetical protein
MESLIEIEALARYDALLTPHREAFSKRTALAFLNGTERDPSLLHLFLIHYAAFGVWMTRPVEGWINRAGLRCRDSGFIELGDSLIAHAQHEAGHHRLMIADLWALTKRWNADHRTAIDPVSLGRGKIPASIGQYRDLHEEIIVGDTAYSQIALEYEIEALSVRHGADLVAAADRTFSDSRREGLSFLREHVLLDAAHTQFNRRQIARLLAEHPTCLDALVETGRRALDVYGRFIDDCLRAALSVDCTKSQHIVEDRLFHPIGEAAIDTTPEWLLQIRSLRSQVLYDDGARPSFGSGGVRYGDADPADLYCHHLALFENNAAVGAVRLSLADGSYGASLVDATFGVANTRQCIEHAGFRRQDCAEAGRLVLHPDYRHGRTVQRLFAGLWALAAESGASAILAAVGTANHQDRLFSMFGAKMLDDAGSISSPKFDDRLRLAIFPINRDVPPDYPELEHMQEFIARSHNGTKTAAAA